MGAASGSNGTPPPALARRGSRFIAFDTESYLIRPGLLAPKMVCLSYATDYATTLEVEKSHPNVAALLRESGPKTGLVLRDEGLELLRGWLADESVTLIGHNLPYDLGVACAADDRLLGPVFAAYAAGRLRCTIVRQKLLDIAFGMRKWRRLDGKVSRASYGLADLVELYFNEHVAKGEDTWRLRYAELDDVPVAWWPEDARAYALSDAVLALRLFHAQEENAESELQWTGAEAGEIPNEVPQQRSAWALHLMSMWGVRAEQEAVDHFIARCEEEIAKMHRDLAGTGIFRPSGSRDMKLIRQLVVESCERQQAQKPVSGKCKLCGEKLDTESEGGNAITLVDGRVQHFGCKTVKVPRTPTGLAQTDKETLEESDDPNLHVLAAQMSFAKHLGQWGPVCRAAIHRPVCARYENLVETGRTSCSGGEKDQQATNFQNPPRKGDVRPCFIARPGFVLCSTDADTIELRAHAQNCYEMMGWSRMRDYLIDQAKTGAPDLHEVLGAQIMGVDPLEVQARIREGDDEASDGRQFAKIPNFGFPGGLGAETFVSYAAGQLDREAFLRWFGAQRAEQIANAQGYRETWFETFPENREYFQRVGGMIDRETGVGTIRQLMSGRVRGDVRFTAVANGFFQGRVADAMKDALFVLADECYVGVVRATGKRSPLFGSRPIMFLHDEPIVEHPENGSETERAERQRQVVLEALARWMPDVPTSSSAVLTRRWHKGAKPLVVGGQLVPVRPEKVDGKVKWVQDFGMAA